ncbi:hypothetical protein DERF_011916 [Dermatophagoides farinae]|uniref:Uncharacterized protein n=1 Tax=Dermatophagoides farinae TaxID=6954 RepID=A0A922KZI0_DERFA|nr:hypothetical protein DERF_011916 [Dermatophagoides farinae]
MNYYYCYIIKIQVTKKNEGVWYKNNNDKMFLFYMDAKGNNLKDKHADTNCYQKNPLSDD